MPDRSTWPPWPAAMIRAVRLTAGPWKSLPSWYSVSANDQVIAPDEERMFAKRMGATTIEIPSSHVAMVSHPNEVTKLIELAAQAVTAGK